MHLEWDACPAAWRARCVGKESYPTIAFNVSILHSREIIHVSDWCSGATNDLTQAKHDALFEALHTESQRGLGVPDAQLKYMLLNKDGVEQQFEQLYAIVDGGYHAWRCLQAPLKHAAGDDAARWSDPAGPAAPPRKEPRTPAARRQHAAPLGCRGLVGAPV